MELVGWPLPAAVVLLMMSLRICLAIDLRSSSDAVTVGTPDEGASRENICDDANGNCLATNLDGRNRRGLALTWTGTGENRPNQQCPQCQECDGFEGHGNTRRGG